MIPPFVSQIIGTLVRAAIVALVGAVAARGIVISDSQTTQLIAWATPLVATLAWSIYSKYVGRQKLLTAAASPQVMTEHEVEAKVNDPGSPTPSVMTSKDALPR